MVTKLLKMLFALLALVVGVVLIIPAFQAKQFRVERSRDIAAPVGDIFPLVNDLNKFNEWSPWAKLDPDAKAVFSEQTEGVGASFSWEGNYEVGKGSMTNIESRPNELIRFRMDFLEPMEATDTAEFTFHPQNDGTKVTWAIYGERP